MNYFVIKSTSKLEPNLKTFLMKLIKPKRLKLKLVFSWSENPDSENNILIKTEVDIYLKLISNKDFYDEVIEFDPKSLA